MNGLNLRRQDRPFCVRMLPKLLSRQRPALVETHIARLDGIVLPGFGDANNIQITAFGIVYPCVTEIRVSVIPRACLEVSADLRILEDPAVFAKDNATHKFQIIKRQRRDVRHRHGARSKIKAFPFLYRRIFILSLDESESSWQ